MNQEIKFCAFKKKNLKNILVKIFVAGMTRCFVSAMRFVRYLR